MTGAVETRIEPVRDGRHPGSAATHSRGWWLIPAALVLVIELIYAQAGSFGFVNLDDDSYVYRNLWVHRGLSWNGVWWAFRTLQFSNWHPLTWLSHMADVELFGIDPGWHHVVNVVIHGLNALLLFAALAVATGRTWRAAIVAALFATHPLNVESVAWISERKNVLSTSFWLLSTIAYGSYVRRKGAWTYLALAGAFTLGLLAKPMLVTLPLVLLVLDFWPLRRIRSGASTAPGDSALRTIRGLVKEQLPLFALSACFCAVTFVAQGRGGAIHPEVPTIARVANAIVSYGVYLVKTVWPFHLFPAYPHPTLLGAGIPPWQLSASALLLVAASALAWRARRDRPYLLAGWLWYAITLLPVIGLVQVGLQSMADRFAYVPLIGVFTAVTWLGGDWSSGSSRRQCIAGTFALFIVAAFVVIAHAQTRHWRDSFALFRHSVSVDPTSYMAWRNLGYAYYDARGFDEAIAALRESIRLMPRDGQAWMDLGLSYSAIGRNSDADRAFEEAGRLRPDDALLWRNIAIVAANRGDTERLTAARTRLARISPEQLADTEDYLRGTGILP